MTDTPRGFPQSLVHTNVIPGGKRKQVSSSSGSGVGATEAVSESSSKKARRETHAECSPSSEEFEYGDMGTGEEAETMQSHVAGPQQAEIAEAELKRLQKDWTAPIYGFFKPTPTIEYIGGRRVHVFECIADTCKGRGRKARQVNRYLDKADARSTSNLRKHAKMCWGPEVVEAADRTRNIETTRSVVAGMTRNPSSPSDGAEKGKLSYILATPAQ